MPASLAKARKSALSRPDLMKVLDSIRDVDVAAALYERSLYAFVKKAWSVLEPATRFVDGRHIAAKCEYLEAVTLGQIQFLVINEPPRHMKSLVASVMWPCWEWIDHPAMRYLFSSYSGELSNMHSMNRRTLLESEWYQGFWSDRFTMRSDNNRKTEFENDKRGIMSCTSTGATATGKGGERVVIDDPINPAQALSDAERATANTYFDQTLYTRLNDKQKDAIILIMQRVHQNDLTGHLLNEKKEMGWTVLDLQAEAEKRTVISLPISKKQWIREKGDILWPEKEPKKLLAMAKVTLGSYAYAGQYQQRPSPTEGGLIKRDWWRRYSIAPRSYDRIIISVDAAFKDLDTSSYVCVQVWGIIGVSLYLIENVRRRIDFVLTIQSILAMIAKHKTLNNPISAVLVEDKANGTAIVSMFQKKVPGLLPVEPHGSKAARAAAHSATIEAGNVYVPDGSEGDSFIEEWAMFPNGEFWDQIDAASQAFDYASRTTLNFDFEGFNSSIPQMESANANW